MTATKVDAITSGPEGILAGIDGPLPSAAVAAEMLARASDLGCGHRDVAAVRLALAESPA